MTQPSTISMERLTPGIRKITFSNPPVNLIVGETVSRLVEVVTELSEDPQVHVVVFTSSTPGYFFNHFDLDRVADFMPSDLEATPAWIDLVIRLSTAPFISIASIRGRTRGGGDELALACDLRYASREHAVFGQPEVGGGILPGGGGTERLPRLIGRDRALEGHGVHLARPDGEFPAAHHRGHGNGARHRHGRQRGRQTALAQAQLVDATGRLLAHATSSCMLFPVPAPRV